VEECGTICLKLLVGQVGLLFVVDGEWPQGERGVAAVAFCVLAISLVYQPLWVFVAVGC